MCELPNVNGDDLLEATRWPSKQAVLALMPSLLECDVTRVGSQLVIDLAADLALALESPEIQDVLHRAVRSAVREELRVLLDDELLDVAAAAELLNMSQAAVRKAVERGQLPCVRVGRRVRFRRGELIRLSAQQ